MNIQEAERIALQAMDEHGLLDEEWYLRWDKSIKTWGSCHFGKKQITLSKPITEISKELDFMNTVLHEIAHALVGIGKGHGRVWKTKAKQIGCSGDRCYDGSISEPLKKIKGICPNGHEVNVARIPRVKKSCGMCSPRFNEDFLLTFTKRS